MDIGGEASTSADTSGSVFNDIHLEGRLCDVVIRVADVEFEAHKIILCGCTSYFRALFASGWTTSEKRIYNIPGVAPHMMRLIIEYAYTRSVPVTENNVEELLAAADQFCVMGIVQACCDFLEDQLRLENCIGVWKLTEVYYCPDLRRKAYLFILHHFEEMLGVSEQFVELSLQQLTDLIEKDELNVKQESTVFEAVLRWIAHVPQERNGHISVLLPKVRLALMTAGYFMNNVKNNPLVKGSDECEPVIINAQSMYYSREPPSNSGQNPLSRPRLPRAILLATGGWSGNSLTNAIEVYDPRANRWGNFPTNDAIPRAYHGAAFLGGFVYCIGGFGDINTLSSMSKFNLVTRTWHQAAPMHSCRCYVSVAVLNGCIYVMGGFDGHRVMQLNNAERYQPETNQWTQIAPMNERRSNTSATTLHGKVYICGGFRGTEWLLTAECYDPETNQWTLIAPMSCRRAGVGIVAYGEHVYAVGGFDGTSCLHSVEAYSPLMNSWRSVPSMLNARSNFGIEVVDGQLFVVGGYYNGVTTTCKVECYDDKAAEWNEAADMEFSRSALSCCVVSGLPNMAEYTAPRNALPPST